MHLHVSTYTPHTSHACMHVPTCHVCDMCSSCAGPLRQQVHVMWSWVYCQMYRRMRRYLKSAAERMQVLTPPVELANQIYKIYLANHLTSTTWSTRCIHIDIEDTTELGGGTYRSRIRFDACCCLGLGPCPDTKRFLARWPCNR